MLKGYLASPPGNFLHGSDDPPGGEREAARTVLSAPCWHELLMRSSRTDCLFGFLPGNCSCLLPTRQRLGFISRIFCASRQSTQSRIKHLRTAFVCNKQSTSSIEMRPRGIILLWRQLAMDTPFLELNKTYVAGQQQEINSFPRHSRAVTFFLVFFTHLVLTFILFGRLCNVNICFSKEGGTLPVQKGAQRTIFPRSSGPNPIPRSTWRITLV